MRRLDALLVHPGNRMQVYQQLGAELAAIEPPVWATLMATYLRGHGYAVDVLDAEAEGLTPDQTAERIGEVDPVLAAVVVYGHQPSASTQTMPAAGAICRAVKERGLPVKTVLVGGHVAALPDRTLREEAADFVAGGEGPVTLAELIGALTASAAPDLSKVRGLFYYEDGRVRANPAAPLVRDLDREMRHQAWDRLDMSKYRAHNWHCFGDLRRQPYASIYTSLGCPYHCSFCCIQAPFKDGERELGRRESVNSYRLWSPSAVVDQLEFLQREHGVRNVKIADEMFVLNPRHVLGICDGIVERGLDLNIWAYARVDTVRDGMLERLKRAGVNWLCFGVEAGSERVRDSVEKRFEQDEVYRTILATQAAGINVIGNYIFGLPEDDHETMQATLDLALDLKCEFANFYSAMAYPGSPLYALAIQRGWPLPESWSGYSQHSVDTLPLPTNYLTAADVLRFRDRAFQTYFSDPGYLALVERKFGPATLEHVRSMAAHTLVRKHS